MKAKPKTKPRAGGRKRPAPPKPKPLPPVRTADQGVPEPPPYAGSGWDYESVRERAGAPLKPLEESQ